MRSGLEVRQRIDAPPDLIWRACTTPQGLANWQADSVEGRTGPGEKLRLRWAAFGAEVELEIVDWTPQRSLAFKRGSSLVEFRLEDRELVVTETDDEGLSDLEGLRSSWVVALAQLAHCVERHPGRQRTVQWLVSDMATTAELVYLAVAQPELRARWLSRSPGEPLGGTGTSYRLDLAADVALSGRVLAKIVGRDLALSCTEYGDSTLIIRTFPSPTRVGDRIVALCWSAWGPPLAEGQSVVRCLSKALGRLPAVVEGVARA